MVCEETTMTTVPSGPFYKVLKDGRSCHGGDLAWSLPRVVPETGEIVPGDWHEVAGQLVLCERGLHLTTAPYKAWYCQGATVYEAEARDIAAWDRTDGKCVCRAARLLAEVPDPEWLTRAKQAIADIATVPWFSRRGPVDATWRVFPTRAAAWDAARAAAWDAARAAAWAGAGAAAWDAARAAAWDAAGAGAGAAAWDAARAAAWDAAWAAARDAAWAAARAAAWAAAGAAARDAAWAAAGAAAGAVLAELTSDLVVAPEHVAVLRGAWAIWRAGYGAFGLADGIWFVYERP
jgi:hypothetical protein